MMYSMLDFLSSNLERGTIIMDQQPLPMTAIPSVKQQQDAIGSTGEERAQRDVGSKQDRDPIKIMLEELQDPGIAQVMALLCCPPWRIYFHPVQVLDIIVLVSILTRTNFHQKKQLLLK